MSDLSNQGMLKSDVRSQMFTRFFSAFTVQFFVKGKIESNVFRLDVQLLRFHSSCISINMNQCILMLCFFFSCTTRGNKSSAKYSTSSIHIYTHRLTHSSGTSHFSQLFCLLSQPCQQNCVNEYYHAGSYQEVNKHKCFISDKSRHTVQLLFQITF